MTGVFFYNPLQHQAGEVSEAAGAQEELPGASNAIWQADCFWGVGLDSVENCAQKTTGSTRSHAVGHRVILR